MPEISVVEGDILDQNVEVIVNPWNRNIIPWWLLLPHTTNEVDPDASLFSSSLETRLFMSDPLLMVPNHHVPACGDPPIIDGSSTDQYVGYFENSYGEQWIFTLDRKTGKAVLRGGDIGWNTAHAIVDGRANGLILSGEKQLWLNACWAAASQQTIS